ncbi:MAG: putative membrane protein, partial [Sphingobacteriales bacterium]
RSYEDYGASKVGSLFLYVLVASIGMKMNLLAIQDSPGYFLIGLIWMLIHITVLLTTAKIIKAPFFFTAVGSQANVGGAASAPIVASAFHPALASVGVLLAVLGYALGTYAAYFCALLMQAASAGV